MFLFWLEFLTVANDAVAVLVEEVVVEFDGFEDVDDVISIRPATKLELFALASWWFELAAKRLLK